MGPFNLCVKMQTFGFKSNSILSGDGSIFLILRKQIESAFISLAGTSIQIWNLNFP